MGKRIQVKYVDFCSESIPGIIHKALKENFDEVIVSDTPEFLFYSTFGYEHLNYDCVRIFWTGENAVPDFNICDYAIGFAHITFEDRYTRIPLYYFYIDDYSRAIVKNLDATNSMAKRKFCNFIYSNKNADPIRDQFMEELSKYKTVDSGGRHKNNIGGPVKDKYHFQCGYKFSIAFENCSSNGYTTEKIMQAFAAKTIPIYWGNPKVAEDFNEYSFINCHSYISFEQVIKKIIELDKDDIEYMEMLRTPIGDEKKFPDDPLKEFKQFITDICSQPIDKARRRNNVAWNLEYQNKMRNLYKKEKYKHVLSKLFRGKSQ